MYPVDTICVGDSADTIRTIPAMGEWYDRAKSRMVGKGVTQEQLMELFGVKTRGAVGHYLNGRRDPSSTVLVTLADRLEMTLDELLRGESQPVSLSGEILASAIEEARRTAANLGMDDFDPSDPHDAEMVAEALYELTGGTATATPEKAHQKFEREARTNGKQSGTGTTRRTGGATRSAKAGGEGVAPGSRRRKSA
jgi:transcriptional regulator with XRE-family HTH domain